MNSPFRLKFSNTVENSFLLTMVFLCSAIHFYFFHGGYFGFDDVEYMKQSLKLTHGDFMHDSLYSFRYAIVIPLAFLYDVFGSGDLANWLFQSIVLVGIAFILLKLLKTQHFLIRLVSLAYLVVHPMHLLYMEKPMPDIVTEFGFLLCLFAYLRVKHNQFGTSGVNSLLFLLGFLLMFLSKETFIIIYPFFLFLLVRDFRNKELLSFWRFSLLGLFIIISIYFLSYQVLLNNAFARLDAIFTNRFISACTYDLQPLQVLIERVAYKCWLEMIRNCYLLPLGFSIVMFLRRKFLERLDLFFLYAWWGLLMIANFMTISYSSYVPLCDDTRHFLFIVPVGIMIWAWGWNHVYTFSIRDQIIVIIFWFIQLFLSWYFNYENSFWLYLILAGAIIFNGLFKEKKWTIIIAIIGTVSIFIQNANYNYSTNHYGQKELIDKVLEDGSASKYILTDPANSNIGNYKSGYDNRYLFLEFKEFDSSQLEEREYYIILNGMTAYLSGSDWNKMPEIAKTAHDRIPVFFENKAGVVYKIPLKK